MATRRIVDSTGDIISIGDVVSSETTLNTLYADVKQAEADISQLFTDISNLPPPTPAGLERGIWFMPEGMGGLLGISYDEITTIPFSLAQSGTTTEVVNVSNGDIIFNETGYYFISTIIGLATTDIITPVYNLRFQRVSPSVRPFPDVVLFGADPSVPCALQLSGMIDVNTAGTTYRIQVIPEGASGTFVDVVTGTLSGSSFSWMKVS